MVAENYSDYFACSSLKKKIIYENYESDKSHNVALSRDIKSLESIFNLKKDWCIKHEQSL